MKSILLENSVKTLNLKFYESGQKVSSHRNYLKTPQNAKFLKR